MKKYRKLTDEEIMSYLLNPLPEKDKWVNPYTTRLLLAEYKIVHDIYIPKKHVQDTFYEAALLMNLIYKYQIRDSKMLNHYMTLGYDVKEHNASYAVDVALNMCENPIEYDLKSDTETIKESISFNDCSDSELESIKLSVEDEIFFPIISLRAKTRFGAYVLKENYNKVLQSKEDYKVNIKK